ncbi:MAG TPA: ATP-binding protein, partial [Myxococcota bacterium]|nr:ATP-binding protein [Myxococcota bacterium]
MMGICVGVAVAPMASSAALGASNAAAIGGCLRTVATGATFTAAYGMYAHWRNLVSDSTAFLNRFRVTPNPSLRLDLDDELRPTVFGVGPALAELTLACAFYLKQGRPFGLQKALLHGPAGTGKTVVAQAIANRLDVPMFEPNTAQLLSDANAPQAVLRLFQEAHEYSRRMRRPVVLFFDDAESLFPDRRQLGQESARDRDAAALVNVFLTCLDGVNRHADTSVLVVAATNHIDKLDPALRQRFLTKARLALPDAATAAKIIGALWEEAQGGSPLGAWDIFAPEPEDAARL